MKTLKAIFAAFVSVGAGIFVLPTMATEYWVDAEHGSDGNGGTSAQDAWLTLTNAAAHAKSSGDVIWALPGYYTNGAQKAAANHETLNRVNLASGVILRSTQGAKKTFIIGAVAPSDPDAYGCGVGAVRCAYLNGTAKISGFTITGGRTGAVEAGSGIHDWVTDYHGGGAYCASGSGVLEDCVISNNFCHIGSAGYNLNFVRCRIKDNLSHSGSAGWDCSYYSTVVSGNSVWGADQGCMFQYKNLYDSTIGIAGPNIRNGTTSIMLRNGRNKVAYGCIFVASPPGNEKLVITNCVYTYLSQNPEFVPGAGSFKATTAELALDDDLRPTKASVAVDKIATTAYDSAYTAVADVDGGQRVYNVKRDIGAAEFDWCSVYAADLAKDSLAITNATASVEEIEALKIRLVDGARLAGVWTPCGESRVFYATVTGAGTFTFAANGAAVKTVTAADGKTGIDLSAVASESPVSFSFAGEGSVELTRTAVQFTLPAEDAQAKLTVTGAMFGKTVVLNPGDTVTIAPNDTGTRMAASIVVNGVTYAFADLPGGVWSYTVADPPDANHVALTAVGYSTDWYVDCEKGEDSADRTGISSNTAWKTLAYASAKVTTSGHRLLALPGHYRTGTVQATTGNKAPHVLSRVNVRSGVTLEALRGPNVTFIHGEAATADNGADDWGRGTNAVRCATVSGTLRGFTLLDGRTRGTDGGQSAYDPNYRGAAVYGGTVEDCVISNCYAWCSTAGQSATFVRCRIYDCWGTEYAGGWNCYYDNTIVDRLHDTCPNQWGSMFQPYRVRNCMIGRAYYPSGSEAYVIGEVNANTRIFANNVVLGSFGYTKYDKATNCVFVGYVNGMVVTETCWKSTEAALKLDDDFKPAKDSPLVDAGHGGYAKDGESDVYGGQRIYNGTIDVGAVEYDWRGEYAKDIAKKGAFDVTAATTNVVESAANTVVISNGQSLAGVWTAAVLPKTASVKARLAGTGVLTVKVGGVAVAALEGPVATATNVEFPAEAGKTVEFAYDGEDGYAEILKTGLSSGLVLFLR